MEKRQFYRAYQIPSVLRTELNWSRYKFLIAILDPDKRAYVFNVSSEWNAKHRLPMWLLNTIIKG